MLKTIGSHTALLPEAQDASHCPDVAECTKDGESGDIEFPFGNMKPVATVGEVSATTGEMLVGVPDGMGSYLSDDETVRIIVQSESYGPLAREAYPFPVNDGRSH